jgi:hypothetical protein
VNNELIDDVVSHVVEITFFAFHVEERTDGGGKTIDIYMVENDIEIAQRLLKKIFPKVRLIFFEMTEERIYEMHDKCV